MTIVVLSDGMRDACRKKAAAKICDLSAKFNALPESEQFEKAHLFFECARKATEACVENFEPQNFIDRRNNQKPLEEIQQIMAGGLQGIYLMENTCNVMGSVRLSQFNGASGILAACVKTAEILKQKYIELTGNVLVDHVMPSPGLNS